MTRLTLHEPVRWPRSVGRTLCRCHGVPTRRTLVAKPETSRQKLWPVEGIAAVAVHNLQVADQGDKPLPSSSFPLPPVGLGT